MSLGGVRDEAEIRGHRRTYIGAIPGRHHHVHQGCGQGRILYFCSTKSIRSARTLRAIRRRRCWKYWIRSRTTTSTDHFLDIPFDLSKVMFITTANSTETIPRPLLDRMEVISVPGYTEEEKVKIAQQYLIPKQLRAHGLKPKNFLISEKAIHELINDYTRESGVRNLEREVGSLCRKVARKIVSKRERLSALRRPVWRAIWARRNSATTLSRAKARLASRPAWRGRRSAAIPCSSRTAVVPGTGKIQLTGQLGDVMQESAKAAITYIRSIAGEYGIDKEFYKKNDLHVHVPEGAVPKDGPSAGVTMFTSVMSALTGNPIRKDVAMTGRDHAARQGASGRRHQGKGTGGAPRRDTDDPPAA